MRGYIKSRGTDTPTNNGKSVEKRGHGAHIHRQPNVFLFKRDCIHRTNFPWSNCNIIRSHYKIP